MLSICLMIAARGSIATANSNGLKGQRCLVPRSTLKLPDPIPLVITAERGEEYRICIHVIIIIITQSKFMKCAKKLGPFQPIKGFLGIKRDHQGVWTKY